MSDTPPDRLAVNPNSPFYDEKILERGIGIRFKGVEKTNVEEYCVSEGWVRRSAGKTLASAQRSAPRGEKGASDAPDLVCILYK